MTGRRGDEGRVCLCDRPDGTCAGLAVRRLSLERVRDLAEEIWTASSGYLSPVLSAPDPRSSRAGASAKAAFARCRQRERANWRLGWAWRRRRAAAASPTGTLRGLLSQTQALTGVLDGWVSVPVRPLLCVHGRWPARASRLFSRIRVAPLRQLADVIRSGPATDPDAVELASARLLGVLRPAA